MRGFCAVRHRMILLLIAILLIGRAEAGGTCMGSLNADQIKNCLVSPIVSRGISRHTRGITVEGQQAAAPDPSVDLTVNFEFNSARLSNDGMISLDSLGQALSDPALRGERFEIAGHTDAIGSDEYNQKLSEARAQAARDYLARTHGIDPDKLRRRRVWQDPALRPQ